MSNVARLVPIANASSAPAEETKFVLGSGRSLSIESGERETITVRNLAGMTEVEIELTPSGPLLRVAGAAQLQFQSQGAVSFDCAEFRVRARKSIALVSEHDLHEEIGGHRIQHVRGRSLMTAEQIGLQSRQDLALDAGRYLWIDGERVLINC